MKREEIIEHIQAEIEEFLLVYKTATEKSKPYKIKALAENITDMLSGFEVMKIDLD